VSTPTPPDPIQEARERALAEFLAPGALPDTARQAEAEAHLLAELEREIGVTIEPPTRVPVRAAADRSPGGFGRLFAMLLAPRMRPALAAAVAVVVIAGAWMQFAPGRRETAPQMRGPGVSASGWNAVPATTTIGDARVRLSWNPAPGATHYAVVFLAGDLSEVARVDDLSATELLLASGALPAGLPAFADVPLLCRVSAYSGPDEIARSTTSPVTLP